MFPKNLTHHHLCPKSCGKFHCRPSEKAAGARSVGPLNSHLSTPDTDSSCHVMPCYYHPLRRGPWEDGKKFSDSHCTSCWYLSSEVYMIFETQILSLCRCFSMKKLFFSLPVHLREYNIPTDGRFNVILYHSCCFQQ